MTTLKIVYFAAWLASASLAASCGPLDSLLGKDDNKNYCPRAPCTSPDTSICASNNDCAFPSVCDTAGTKQCVQCTVDQPGACTGTMPVCSANNTCQACTSHGECPLSNVCAPDGSCAAVSEVAYVDAIGADNSTCSKIMPCAHMAKALTTGRRYIKLHGVIDETVIVGGGVNVTFLADPGAVLMHDGGGGAVLIVKDDGTSLAVHDLTISGTSSFGVLVASGSGEPILSLIHAVISGHTGTGVSVQSGTFTLTRSAIVGNLGGGVFVDGTARFSIVGNTFFANGGLFTLTGAARITASQDPFNKLEFNTFYKNQMADGHAALECNVNLLTASNNILFSNGTLTTMEQVKGSCTHSYSIIQPGTLPPGTGNFATDPLFKNIRTGDLHVLSGSPAIGRADPNADLSGLAAQDLDGINRIRPATLGAYQAP